MTTRAAPPVELETGRLNTLGHIHRTFDPKNWRQRDEPKPYGPKEMAEDYRAILSRCDGDQDRARQCFEAYLAGRNGMMPAKTRQPAKGQP